MSEPSELFSMHPPSPQEPQAPPMKRGQVALGVAAAIVGHLLTVIPAAVVLGDANPSSNAIGTAAVLGLVAQAVVFLLCLVGGIVLLSQRGGNRGLGLGLLVGWAVGVLVVPVVGFGLCVQAIN